MNKTYDFKNKIAIVFGGLGQIGFEVVKQLNALGTKVVVVTKQVDAFKRQKIEALNSEGIHLDIHEVDITNFNQVMSFAEVIKNKYGICDIIINSAGYSVSNKSRTLEYLDEDIINKIYATNFSGVLFCIKALEPMIMKSSSGVIINISSAAALGASQSHIVYSSAKAAIISMTQNLALMYAPNVRVLCVSPGYLEQATSGIIKQANFNELQKQNIPLGRVATGFEIATSIVSLIQSFPYATGSNFVIDGGRTL